jgi:hypothetical protein
MALRVGLRFLPQTQWANGAERDEALSCRRHRNPPAPREPLRSPAALSVTAQPELERTHWNRLAVELFAQVIADGIETTFDDVFRWTLQWIDGHIETGQLRKSKKIRRQSGDAIIE